MKRPADETDPIGELAGAFAAAATDPEHLAGPDSETDEPTHRARLDENLRAVHAELDAPTEPVLARLLRRAGVPDLTIPLISATPALRRSWFAAIAIAVLFALSVASNEGSGDIDRISFFLTVAPLVPLLGVALAFGRGVDPTHDIVVAAPRDTFRVFLVRSTTVLLASASLLALASIVLPVGGLYRVAWLLPALALTSVTMAASAGRDPRPVAAAVAAGWVVIVVTVSAATSSEAMFGPVTQTVALVAAVVAGGFVVRRRRLLDAPDVPS